MFHAEVELTEEQKKSLPSANIQIEEPKPEDPHVYSTFLGSRPKEMEDYAVDLVIKLCKESGVRCHIVHLASSDAIYRIRPAKNNDLPLTVETCFHYLFFQNSDVPPSQPKFKCCPPIRDHYNRELLWKALDDGFIDMVVSDHSPCTPNLKAVDDGDFMKSWGGISSLQFGISALYTWCVKYKFGFDRIVEWLSVNPAALIGLSHRKAKIAVGYDADFVIFNPEETFVVSTDQIRFKNKMTPYEGKELQGVVKATYLRGMLVAENGNVIKETNHPGRLLLKNI